MRLQPNAWCSGYNAISVIAVVQFGLAMMPLCSFTSPALISGITSGTLSSCRNALELSTTTQPAWAARGANSFEMLPPALNSAISIPLKESFVNSVTAISCPLNVSFLPTDRAEASNVSLPTGKWRFSRVLIISTPTAPVAPTTATCGFLFIILNTKAGQCSKCAPRVKPSAATSERRAPAASAAQRAAGFSPADQAVHSARDVTPNPPQYKPNQTSKNDIFSHSPRKPPPAASFTCGLRTDGLWTVDYTRRHSSFVIYAVFQPFPTKSGEYTLPSTRHSTPDTPHSTLMPCLP